MPNYNDRFGIPGSEIPNLHRRWLRIKNDCIWDSLDEFILWCSENGYRPSMVLAKIIKSLPHGPNNSRFVERKEIMKDIKMAAPKRTEISVVSPFCNGCKQKCPTNGCGLWKRWFQENWDTKIHKDIPMRPEVDFRYEHPDMIREGRIWRG